MSAFSDWVNSLFGAYNNTQTVDADSATLGDSGEEALGLEMLALRTGIYYIAYAISQCEFRTFDKHREVYGAEYYVWNYEPNRNQNSTEFIIQLVVNMIIDNEALIIAHAGQLFIADTWFREQFGTREDRYQGICVRGEMLADRWARDVIHLQLSDVNVADLVRRLCRQYEVLISDAAKAYRKSSADKGILSQSSAQTNRIADENAREKALRAKFKEFFSDKDAVLSLYQGQTYTPHNRPVRNVSELTDVKNMTDEIYNRVGQALHIPPPLLRGDVSGVKDARDEFVEGCVKTYCNILSEELTRKRYESTDVRQGSYIICDPASLELGNVFTRASQVSSVIGSGIYSPDDIRAIRGEERVGNPITSSYYVTKNYGDPDDKTGQPGKESNGP